MTETALTTALNTSYMAERLSVFGIVVGVALLLSGVGFVILALAVFGREPKAAPARKLAHSVAATVDPGTGAGGPDRRELRPPGADEGRRREPPPLFADVRSSPQANPFYCGGRQ